MTNNRLLELLQFEEIKSAEIINQKELYNGATLIIARINDEHTVPFVHYTGKDWLFTPMDWQTLPSNMQDIESITWRVNNTDTEAIIFDGLPMLAPWIPEP